MNTTITDPLSGGAIINPFQHFDEKMIQYGDDFIEYGCYSWCEEACKEAQMATIHNGFILLSAVGLILITASGAVYNSKYEYMASTMYYVGLLLVMSGILFALFYGGAAG